MSPVNQMNLRAVRSAEDAVALLRLLGYEARALPFDLTVLGLVKRLRNEVGVY